MIPFTWVDAQKYGEPIDDENTRNWIRGKVYHSGHLWTIERAGLSHVQCLPKSRLEELIAEGEEVMASDEGNVAKSQVLSTHLIPQSMRVALFLFL